MLPVVECFMEGVYKIEEVLSKGSVQVSQDLKKVPIKAKEIPTLKNIKKGLDKP